LNCSFSSCSLQPKPTSRPTWYTVEFHVRRIGCITCAMDPPTPGVQSFTEAVMMQHTPVPRQLTSVARDSVSDNGVAASAGRHYYGKKHSCSVCEFRSRSIADMASHSHTDCEGVVVSQQCSGESIFTNSYAHAVHMCRQPGEGLYGGALVSPGGPRSPSAGAHMEFPQEPGSPASAGAMYTPPAGRQAQVQRDNVTAAGATRSVDACSAPLSDIMARL
jgi:hypothetical protein